MIRVLHVTTDSNIGGAGHHLLDLLDTYDRSAFEMDVILPEGSKLVPLLRERGTAFTEAPHIADRSFSWRAVRVLYGLIKQKKPRIVHTHAVLSGRLAARLCGCKIVHTRHSVFTPETEGYGAVHILKRGVTGFVNNALSDVMIAVSPAAKDDLLRTGARADKIRVIYNGVNAISERSPEEKAALRIKYGVPEGAFVAAQVARLTEVKGHDYVLDAVKDVSGLYVLMAGDGSLKEHLQRRLADESIRNVKLLGFVTAMDELINIMDVQINASYGTEATSLALLQGMSLGVPAVVSDYGGNPYVIEDGLNGLIVPKRNSDALRDAILRLQQDGALHRQLSEGARQRYNEKFTVGDMTAQIEALYREMIIHAK